MAIVPDPAACTTCGGGGSSTSPEFEHNSVVLCDTLPDGTVVAAVILVQEYDELTGLPVGSPVPTDPATGLPYVVQGTLQSCSREQAPVFAGFVCDVFGGSPMIPETFATCPGGALAAPVAPLVGSGLTEGPAGTYIVTGAVNQSLNMSSDSPTDPQHGICAMNYVLNAANGDAGFTAWGGGIVDLSGNGFSFSDPGFLAAMQASLGFPSDTSIPSGTTGSALLGSTLVTLTIAGPSQNTCVSSGTGNFITREGDFDGLASGIELTFSPPVRQVSIAGNNVVDNATGFSNVQVALAAPGTPAIPAAPASNNSVKQFRNSDGTSFYENLDGTAHVVLGTIGDCGDYAQEVLCDQLGVNFLRVYAVINGAVSSFQDYDLAGATFAPTGAVGLCDTALATFRHTPVEVLCYTDALGTVTQFLRRYLIDQDGVSVVAVIDSLLDGTTAFVAATGGTVGQCSDQECQQVVLGTICYVPPPVIVPAQTLTDTWAGSIITGPAGTGAHTWTHNNFGGAGITVIGTSSVSSTALANSIQNFPPTSSFTLDLGAPRNNIVIEIQDIDIAESLTAISPAATAVTAPGVLSAGNTQLNTTVDNSFLFLSFPDGTQFITFTTNVPAGFQVAQRQITFDTIASSTSQTQGTAAVVRDCETGAISYVDLATGLVVDIDTVTVVDCGSSGGCSSDSSLGTICYTPPPVVIPAQTLSDTWLGAAYTPGPVATPHTATNSNFGGAGITVITVNDKSDAAINASGSIRFSGTPTGDSNSALDLGAPRNNIFVTFGQLGTDTNETLENINPPAIGITGTGVLAGGGTQVLPNQPSISSAFTLQFPDGTQNIQFTYRNTIATLGAGQNDITFDTIPSSTSQTQGTAAVVRDCETGAISYVDLTTGLVLDLNTVTIEDCGTDTTAVVTASAQNRLLTAGQSWTPGTDVTGTLTGLAFAVITGTATVTDQNGTVAAGLPVGVTGSWQVEDANTLDPPQSIAAVGGNTYVTWSER